MVEQIRKVKPRDFAMEQIKWYISEQKLGPHAKLPSERQLCEEWNINRSTLRSAIKRLTEENILYSEVGSGTYVAPPKFRINLQDAKSTTESFKGTGNFLWTDVVDSEMLKADEFLAEKLGISEGSKVFCLKRIRRKNNVPFRLEESYINYQLCEGIENNSFIDVSLFKVLKNYGLILYQGNEDIGIEYASSEIAEKLDVKEGSFLFCLSGITTDVEGRVVEYFNILSRPDQAQFSSSLRMDVD